MYDKKRIIDEYNQIVNKNSSSHLLPIHKVLDLERSKYEFIDSYLSKITHIIDQDHIETTADFTIEQMLEKAKRLFGDLNFSNYEIVDGEKVLHFAFHFSILSINDNGKDLKYNLNIFWDM
jgi:hypothetical protein